MELLPVETTQKRADVASESRRAGTHLTEHLSLSDHARMMARVETVEISERELFTEIRTVGRIELDETRVEHISARVDGRVDEVFANFTGTNVKEGDHLVSIYSPSLLSTQEEFLLTYRREQEHKKTGGPEFGPSLSASSRRRLELWGITKDQLDELARTGKADTHLVVHSPIGGTVIEKNIRAGQYVKEGDSLFTVADLRHVWLILEIYEYELSWIRFGQPVEVALESEPATKFLGTIGFIEPLLNEATRTVRVRVILKNEAGKLKPGMYAQALIRVPIMRNGSPAPTGLEGKYACPMHPYVVSDSQAKCSVCRMPLELVPGEAEAEEGSPAPRILAVPAEAVLTTGRRRLVYVEQAPGEYHVVEPTLSARAGDYFPVLGGLEAGQRVVVQGNFLLDSQFQVTGKPSLLYPQGISGGGTGHSGHAEDAGSSTPPMSPHPGRGKIEKTTGDQRTANLATLSSEDLKIAIAQRVCPISDQPLGEMGVPVKVSVDDRALFLCCKGCEPKFRENPRVALRKLAQPHSNHTSHEK
jgi:Cu(I)/Ag(I) efflux system membrane fusion protein